MRKIDKIIIHHSATDYAHHDNIAWLRKVHIKERGWSDIGYHYFIDKKGFIFICRPIARTGAHCKGHNRDSIGICISGANGINDKQKDSLIRLSRNLVSIFSIKIENILLHRDLTDTLCPNFEINFLKESLYV